MRRPRYDLDYYILSVGQHAGDDWNTPRSRIYIAARVRSLEERIAELSDELYLETEVNKRVREALGIKQ